MAGVARLRIAVVGAGLIGRRHAELVAANPDCTLSAIADPSPAAADFARSLGVAHHPSLEALLGAERPDGVVVGTPNALHVEQWLVCVRAKVTALFEKPVAYALGDGR